MNEIYLAGGCFWGLQKYLSLIRGVVSTEVGYANGKTANPSYEDVCHSDTGHAETVKTIYDPAVTRLPFLLDMYYEAIDPTSLNRQGGDVGSQYRTGIYYTNPDDREIILRSIEKLKSGLTRPVAIEIKPLENYYTAEEYHQNYLDKNPGGYCHIGPDKFERAKSAEDSGPKFHKKTTRELRDTLTPMQFSVTQNAATEPPFDNEYHDNFEKGIYVDITTGEPLFLSSDKFDSSCGWPSFTKPIAPGLVSRRTDTSHGMLRTEARSSLGDAHLGHVFDDGPKELGGLRYCINSASLRFIPKDNMAAEGYASFIPLLEES